MASNEAVSIMQQQAEAFGISLEELRLDATCYVPLYLLSLRLVGSRRLFSISSLKIGSATPLLKPPWILF
jgi:hypothetical protein